MAAEQANLSRWTPALLAALYSAAAAPLIINTIPAINGVLAQELSVSPGMLGAFSSADACGIGAGALLAVALTRRISPRMTVLIGLVLLIASNLASATIDWGMGTVILRVLGGAGTGLILSASTYVFGLGDSERNYAVSMLSLMAASAIMIAVIPIVDAQFGWRTMFIFLAVLMLPLCTVIQKFPERYEVEPEPELAEEHVSKLPMWIALGAVTLATFGQISYFTYLSTLGTASGFSDATVATSLSISGGGAFIGAVLSVVFGARLSGMIPIAVIATFSIMGVIAGGSHDVWIYTAGISVFYCAIPLYGTAQFGLLMRRAPSKSFAVSIAAAQFSGTALAPAIGGFAIEYSGYGLLQALNVFAAFGAYALLAAYCAILRPAADDVGGAKEALASNAE